MYSKGGMSMLMSWIFTGVMLISLVSAAVLDRGSALAAAIMEGSQAGITISVAMAGSICLWSGIQKVMEGAGITAMLSKMLLPMLGKIFPESRNDAALAGHLSANVCANLLGLGNAATPMGIAAAKRLSAHASPGIAGDSLCRLVVLNTASIQLIPANVAALRASLGCATPFDILPAVWITSFCSAGLGLSAAILLGKLWKDD